MPPMDELPSFGYSIVGDYLYIKRLHKLEYLKIFETDKIANQ